MKYARSFFIVLLAIISASCTKDIWSETKEPAKNNLITFDAIQVDAKLTRTVIQNETAVFWSPKDSIKVFYGTKSSGKFVSNNTEPVASTSFTGTFDQFDASINAGATSSDFWGVYPYSSSSVCYGDAVLIEVPSIQTACKGTFAPNMFPSIAKSSGLSLSFYNVCGGIMFTVSETGIESVTFRGNNNENIAGVAKVSVNDSGEPVLNSFVSGADAITVNAPDGGTFIPGVKYYLVAYPSNLVSGFSLTYSKPSTEASFSSSASVSISRSKFAKVENKNQGLDYCAKSGNIVFVDNIAKYACVEKFDTNGDGELSYAEALAVNDLNNLFEDYVGVTSFEELKYFANVTDLKGCFYGCIKLKKVTIPETITKIGDNAFRECSALPSITIPSSVFALGNKAFLGCAALSEIIIPASVTEIGSQCFGSDAKLVIMLGTVPPSIDSDSFDAGTKFYVPSSALEKYKNKRNWINFADTIFAIPGGTNCHLVSKSGTFFFDATKKGNSSESVGDVSDVSVLWESFGTSNMPNVGDIVSNIRFNEGIVFLDVIGNDGNAIVGVKNSDGSVLWSWHIWACMGYDPSTTDQLYFNDAGIVMDRNLGATSATPNDVHSIGLLYQWGRKDPFLNCESFGSINRAASTLSWPSPVKSDANSGTIEYSIENPTTFITSNYSGGKGVDWLFTHNNFLWQKEDGGKGVYDPCPAGYRVPRGGESGLWETALGCEYIWASWSGRGINFSGIFGSSSTIWYPASCFIDDATGNLVNAGSHRGCSYGGDLWCCTPYFSSDYSSDRANAVFYTSDRFVGFIEYSYRGRGSSVRCVRE